MPAARAPLKVEVATKIPVRNGLNLADAGVSSGLSVSRTAGTAGAQAAASRAAVEVVTDVPGVLRNVTPVSLGSRLASAGRAAVGVVGAIVEGVSVATVGLLTAGILALDAATTKKSAGLGSDMVGGVKIGSQPKSAPIAKPQVTAQPFKPPAPVVAPVAAPQKPKTQTQTQTQPQVQTQPLPAPVQYQPQPISITVPGARSALETPLPARQKTVNTESPYPLNNVDLDSYGGVNLAYPIAQKLITIPQDIKDLLQPDLDYIEGKLDAIPQTFEEILKRARIETSINVPAKIDLTSQIPLKIDLAKQVPVAVDLTKQVPAAVDLSKQVPIAVDITSQLPLQLDLSKQIPVAVDLSKQVPLTVDLSSKIPLAVDLTSQLPFQLDLSKQVPITVDLSKKVPVAIDLSKSIPVSVDLSKKVPVTVDLSALLTPDSETPNFKDLEQCCEKVQKELKKQSAIIEGKGEIICGEGSTPYSYRGEGLKGIHQLLQIMLGANKQILEHVCSLNSNSNISNIEYPLIEGSGVYGCGTFPPIAYNYSGLGFIGIKNQIDQLFGLDKKILSEVCSIAEIGSFGSLPNISGKIEYFDCDASTHTILYSGNGIEGLSNQVDALSSLVKVGLKASCDTGAIVLMPDMRSEQFKATRQLVITWGTQYPTQQGSLWHSYLPNPVDGLEWCKDFENLYCTKGNILGRLFWENSKMHTGIYCNSEGEAHRVLGFLAMLGNASPERKENGELNIRISKGGKLKRKPAERDLRAVRAAIVEIGADGEAESVICLKPPAGGCLPTLL